MRIAKFISHSGYCSRRDAEKLIKNKRVCINNAICLKPNVNVTKSDKIFVDGKLIKLIEKIRLWKFYKPTNIICTNKDSIQRKTIFEILPKNIPRVISIGRLDYMSEGLILLTNNGDFARKMELPQSNIKRVYKVCIQGNINKDIINRINLGITINGINYKKIKVKIETMKKEISWLIFYLTEGKNREIRNICKFYKLKINKLIRIQFGKYKILDTKPGEIKEIYNPSL